MSGYAMDQRSTEMSVPLDSDGFLRRECQPAREFKWLQSQDASGTPEPVGGYFCPYCAVQGPSDSWHTKAQIELAQNILMREFVDPEFESLGRDLRRSSQGSFIKFDVNYEPTQEMDPLVEPDDMRRVDFPCHPTSTARRCPLHAWQESKELSGQPQRRRCVPSHCRWQAVPTRQSRLRKQASRPLCARA